MNNIDYVVVSNNDIDEFEKAVSARLSDGYVPLGGVAVFQADALGLVYSQALVKGLSNNELSKSNQEGAEES